MRAMILAAGRGQRMRPLTDTIPKPLLVAGGKPLIVWHVERLVRAGITEIIINHAWLGMQIECTLQDGRQYGAAITYSAESPALETAGGIAKALDFFHGRPFLVVNSDIWCDWDPVHARRLGQMLLNEQKLAWLLLADNPPHHPAGDFLLNAAGLVVDRASPEGGAPLTFTGIGIYQPALFENLNKKQPAPLAPLLRQAMRQNVVAGARHAGKWTDVGTPGRLAALDQALSG